jgi:hypothetical protein
MHKNGWLMFRDTGGGYVWHFLLTNLKFKPGRQTNVHFDCNSAVPHTEHIYSKRACAFHCSRHNIACFKATERLHPPTAWPQVTSNTSLLVRFATLLVLSCLHSPGLRCSCCNVVRFCCDLATCRLVTATFAPSSLHSAPTVGGRLTDRGYRPVPISLFCE